MQVGRGAEDGVDGLLLLQQDPEILVDGAPGSVFSA
jgi:hypothetical protein